MTGNGDEKKRQAEIDKRERIVSIVEEGKKSEYWKLLSKAVAEWKEEESEYLDSFKRRGMKETNINEYNRVVDRILFLNRFLTINEKIISYNSGIASKFKTIFKKLIHAVPFMSG